MRAIIQRVTSAGVAVGEAQVASIGHGYCVLIGIANGDDDNDLDYIARKLLSLRLFSDEKGKNWMRNVKEVQGSLLLVSQFTLCHTFKGNKPDFRGAMTGADSKPMFDKLVTQVSSAYRPDRVGTGVFGEFMQVSIVNDGPVTLTVDSRDKTFGSPASPASPSSSAASPTSN